MSMRIGILAKHLVCVGLAYGGTTMFSRFFQAIVEWWDEYLKIRTL